MRIPEGVLCLSLFSLSTLFAAPPDSASPQLSLTVPAGVPLRLYLTKRVSKHEGAPVEARLLDPVYSFDQQVIPAGTIVLGRVDQLHGVPRNRRIGAVLNGDFTPLHQAPVEFTTLVMPDGRRIPLHTAQTLGLNSIVPAHPPKTPATAAPRNTGVVGAGKQKVHDAIQAQIARARSIEDTVRGPDKKEKAEDYLLAKLPYHPQYIRKGTRFDADLLDPLSFGSEPVPPGSLSLLGTQPPPDTVAHARLITPLDSASSSLGQRVEAVLAEPVFSADRKLILPEGTRIAGTVVVAKKARLFHRAGQLRFNLNEFELAPEVARLETAAPAADPEKPPAQERLKVRTQATLQAAESTGPARLKVDGEGGVRAQESKTRFIGAAAAVMIARRAGDNDAERNSTGQITGQSSNVGGRTLGGGLGFGLLGSAISQTSPYVGAAFGYYGMAWSLYRTVIARGAEVQFAKDGVIDIRFNARTPASSAANQAANRPAQTAAGRH